MTYSGIQYPVAAWNGNLTLAEAFQSSCVWYFRQVIDQVGQASVAQQLAALDYGNQDISQWEGGGQNQSPELNGFWIDSSLKISPWSRSRSSPKFLRAAASTPRRRWTPSGPSCWSRTTGPGRSTARRLRLWRNRLVRGLPGEGRGQDLLRGLPGRREPHCLRQPGPGGGLCPAKRNGLTCMSRMPKFHLRGHFFLTGGSGCDKIPSNFILSQTVDAEITAMMPLQRACGAESQVRNKLSNGPLRARQRKRDPPFLVCRDVWAYVSCREMCVSPCDEEGALPLKGRGPPGILFFSSLKRGIVFKRVFFPLLEGQGQRSFLIWSPANKSQALK